MMVHTLPVADTWGEHAPFSYPATFARSLARAGDYGIIEERTVSRGAKKLLCCILQKNDARPMGRVR